MNHLAATGQDGGVLAASPAKWVRCILFAGLLVGIADFVQSFILFSALPHRPVIGIFQGPATGLYGRAAMAGGMRTALIGTTIHFVIALAWAAVFASLYFWSRTSRAAINDSIGFIACAIATGVCVWLFMNFVVLRLSRAHFYTLAEPYFWYLLAGHALFVGIPLLWSLRRCAFSSVR